MKFKIAIEENIVQTFEIEAKTSEEALDEAKRLYQGGHIVIENGDVSSKQMAVIEPKSEVTEWEEF